MKLPCVPSKPLSTRFMQTGRNWGVGRVEVFKFLGRLILFDDADNQAMGSNLRKAQGCWS
jgi:hypothetical protein